MVAEGSSDGRSRSAGIKNHHLPFRHHARGGRGNLQLLLAVQLFLFSQRGVFQSAIACGQRSPMSAMDAALDVKNLQILADGDLRSVELPGQVDDQDPAIAMQLLEDCSLPFFA